MTRVRWFSGWLITAFGTALLAGCSGATDNLPREAVSGKVTLDGTPLANGTIRFDPKEKTEKSMVTVGSVIDKGNYAIPTADGPVPGSYTVSISASGDPGSAAEEAPGTSNRLGLAKELVPGQYNAQTTLKAEVKKGGGNTFDFDLKSK